MARVWYRLAGLILAVLLGSFSTAGAAAPKVEIFSWWTGRGEQEGLATLIKVFQRNYPGIELVNATVAGGGGINAKAVLQTRMVGGTPPDSFQVHGGAELIESYVKTGMMEPITGWLDQWGIRDRFNPQLLEMCSYKGEIYSIPLNVHRGNVLWYNQALLKKYRIQPPNSLDSLLKACQTLQNHGITPLAMGDRDQWEATQIFETILAITLGPAKYNGLWNGRTSFKDPGIAAALEKFKQLMKYVNKNHASLIWQDATKMVYEGKAVFNVMGDWAEGYFKTLGWQPGVEFGWTPLCGAGGNFMVITDTFGLPKGAPHRDAALAWLKTVASVQGQDAFNPVKGSIPSRLDARKKHYDPYLRASMADFAKLTLTPSIAHGSAASTGFSGALDELLNIYLSDGNTRNALRNLQSAARDYLE
jgi:glucose/mannose transport system substrate-binding protein